MPALELRRLRPATAAGLCALNWLVPGLGYVAAGNRRVGFALMIVLNGLVIIGVAYGGTVIRTSGGWSDPAFNIVALLTYITQAFHGLGWGLLQILHETAASDESAYFNVLRLGTLPFSDLGTFHLIVAGGLNYAATTRLWDLTAGNPKLTETLPGEHAAAAATGEAS